MLLLFNLGWKLDTIYGRPNNSFRRENNMFEVMIEICQECAEIEDSGYMKEF
jgi:hypothetical protein